MSRTVRHYPTGKSRDGKQDFKSLIIRDNRATGMRDQKRDRHTAKVTLKIGEDTVLSGKHRRYSDRYGTYDL